MKTTWVEILALPLLNVDPEKKSYSDLSLFLIYKTEVIIIIISHLQVIVYDTE